MLRVDALIVGGGPAGSSCARVLHRAGWDVAVVDRARFPRDKVCAGWVTPQAFARLGLAPAEYRASGSTLQEITGFRTGMAGRALVETRYAGVVSYAIRRCEFDDFLLRRSGARVRDGIAVTSLRRRGDLWIVEDLFETPIVVGAGGHFCPVARHVGGGVTGTPVVAQEAEFCIGDADSSVAPDIPELFFCRDMAGYGWCVRKGRYVNVGLGRRDAAAFSSHRRELAAFLESSRKAPGAASARWRGHAYLASGAGTRPLVRDGVMLIGDAAGLAQPESGEGIGPAIEAGNLAADTLIAAGGRYSADALRPYEVAIRRAHPPARRAPRAARPVVAAIGRQLLRSPRFTRQVVLDRWFLRRVAPGHTEGRRAALEPPRPENADREAYP